jgi:hypothetical protein
MAAISASTRLCFSRHKKEARSSFRRNKFMWAQAQVAAAWWFHSFHAWLVWPGSLGYAAL